MEESKEENMFRDDGSISGVDVDRRKIHQLSGHCSLLRWRRKAQH